MLVEEILKLKVGTPHKLVWYGQVQVEETLKVNVNDIFALFGRRVFKIKKKNNMNNVELKSLLEEVFFEDEYKITESEYIRYNINLSRLYVKCYSKRLNAHFSKIVIKNYIMGTTIVEDMWQMTWSLPKQNYYMIIPGTSTKRNPSDVGDTKSFLMLSKEKLKDVILIEEMSRIIMDDMNRMVNEPTEIVRDFKLKKIL